MSITEQDVLRALSQIEDPDLHRDIVLSRLATTFDPAHRAPYARIYRKSPCVRIIVLSDMSRPDTLPLPLRVLRVTRINMSLAAYYLPPKRFQYPTT